MDDFVNYHFAGVNWCILARYELEQRIGSGGHGVVVSASDKQGKQKSVAIKKTFLNKNCLIYEVKRLSREIRLMRCLNHPNILSLLTIMVPTFQYKAMDIYIVTELMSTDLRHVLGVAHSTQSTFDLRNEQAQYLLYQLLCGAQYLESAGVLHRDLKPSNLLIDLRSCQLRICDFGLARALPRGFSSTRIFPEHGQHASFDSDPCESVPESTLKATMTEYVVTRWYRAPELLLGHVYYGSAIDLWSIGCIFAEMLAPNKGILFQGMERRETLILIIGLLGHPSEQELWFVSDNNAREFVYTLPFLPKGSFSDQLLGGSPPQAVSTSLPIFK